MPKIEELRRACRGVKQAKARVDDLRHRARVVGMAPPSKSDLEYVRAEVAATLAALAEHTRQVRYKY